jgi:hypothetical protein
MRKIALLTVAGALALPTIALAGNGSGSASSHSPAKSCKTLRAGMGVAAFKDLYGTNASKSNAFGKCVSKQTHVQDQAADTAHANAAKACKAERAADANAFANKYGTGPNKANAYGKCVSSIAKAKANKAIAGHDSATVNAAKACKTERTADPAAFASKYGTNANKSNAFGKCVSQKARSQGGSGTGTGTGTGTDTGTGTGTSTGTVDSGHGNSSH